jgi:hypothetical protein
MPSQALQMALAAGQVATVSHAPAQTVAPILDVDDVKRDTLKLTVAVAVCSLEVGNRALNRANRVSD